jgi:hypothetical protein
VAVGVGGGTLGVGEVVGVGRLSTSPAAPPKSGVGMLNWQAARVTVSNKKGIDIFEMFIFCLVIFIHLQYFSREIRAKWVVTYKNNGL